MAVESTEVIGACHCGAVRLTLATAPASVTHCNCALCRRYGVLWAYAPIGEVKIDAATIETETYAWNGRNVDFHRCATCGCVTHWLPRDAERQRMGVNARLLDPHILAAARIERKDSAGTGLFA